MKFYEVGGKGPWHRNFEQDHWGKKEVELLLFLRTMKMAHLPVFSLPPDTEEHPTGVIKPGYSPIQLLPKFMQNFNKSDESQKRKCMERMLNLKFMINYHNEIIKGIIQRKRKNR